MHATTSADRRQLVVSTLGVAGSRLLGGVGGVLVARLLGPEARGELAIAVLVGTAGGLLLSAGLEYWVQRELARAGGDGDQVNAVIRRQERLILRVTFPAALVALAAGWWLAAATIAFSVAWATGMLWLAVPVGSRRMTRVAVATVTSGALYVGGVLVLLLVGRGTVTSVVALGAVGALAVAAIAGRPGPALPRDATAPPWLYARALRFGLPQAGGELLTIAMGRIDIVLVAALASTRAAGQYATALALTEVLWIVPIGFSQVLLPRVAASSDRRVTARLLGISLSAMGALGLILVVAGEPIVTLLFGGAYAEASAALPPLVLAAVAFGAWRLLVTDLVARGHPAWRLTTTAVGLVTMILVDVALIGRLGIVGAGIGSATGYLVAATVAGSAWRRADRDPALALELEPTS